ncbi:hypothetical protein [Helicobacter suis]|uniref:hypothetical protein n=2 Tax=Helicobacter suis TaxID=104628 RepID=UPI0013D6B7B9|nr:hypothetical protein [Helicobacter suis]
MNGSIYNITLNVNGEPVIRRARRSVQQLQESTEQSTQTTEQNTRATREQEKKLKELDNQVKDNIASFKNLAGLLVGGLFAQQVASTIKAISANEQLKNSLTSLIYTNAKNTDSLGNHLGMLDKWRLSTQEAASTYKELDRIQLATKFSLDDLGGMFKSFYSTAGKSMGLKDALKVMEAIAYTAQVSGADVNSLKATLDSLGAGTVATATDFGRFVNSLGLTTEAMSKAKNEGNLANLMLEKMGKFKETAKLTAGSFEETWSNFTNAFNNAKQAALEPYFEGIKKTLAGWTSILDANKNLFRDILATLAKYKSVIIALGAGFLAYKVQLLAVSVATKAYTAYTTAAASAGGVFALSLRAISLALRSMAIPAIIAGIAYIASNWEDLAKSMRSLWEKSLYTLKALWHNFINALKIGMKAFGLYYVEVFSSILETANNGLGRFAPEFLKKASASIVATKNKLKSEIKALAKDMRPLMASNKSEAKTGAVISVPKVQTSAKVPTKLGALEWNLKKDVDPKKAEELAKALHDLARSSMSEYAKKIDDIKQKTQEWIKAGVSKNLALKEQKRLIAALNDSIAQEKNNAQLDFLEAMARSKIELMSAGLDQNIAKENLAYEQSMRHLNEESAKKLESGALTLDQINQQYAALSALHNKKIKDIQEAAKLEAQKAKEAADALAIANNQEWLNNELNIKQRAINLMAEGKEKEIALEKLRHEQEINNLNKEVAAKVAANKMSIDQANKLYELENAQHQANLKALNATKTGVKGAFNLDLSGIFQSGLTNGIEGARDSFISMASDGFNQGFLAPIMRGDLSGALKGIFGEGFKIDGDSFLGKFESVLKGGFEKLGTALAGFGAGIASGNLIGGFIDTQGDRAAAKRMKTGNLIGSGVGAGVGAALTPVLGPLGPILGGVFGGVFGTLIGGFSSKKVETTLVNKGIEFFNTATSKEVNAKYFKDMKQTTTNKSWWGLVSKTSTKFWTEYSQVGTYASEQIKKSLFTYEGLISQFTGAYKTLSIQAGRYDSASQALIQGADAFIGAIMGQHQEFIEEVRYDYFQASAKYIQNTKWDFARARVRQGEQLLDVWEADSTDLGRGIWRSHIAYKVRRQVNTLVNDVRNIWQDYANSIGKDINTAIQEAFSNLSKKKQDFTTWLFDYKGESDKKFQYIMDLANKEKDRILKNLNYGGNVDMDNYLEWMDNMLAANPTPYLLEQVQQVGDLIKQAAEAQKSYNEIMNTNTKATQKATAAQNAYNKAKRYHDLMLAKTKFFDSTKQNENNTTSDKILRTLQSLLSLQRMAHAGIN